MRIQTKLVLALGLFFTSSTLAACDATIAGDGDDDVGEDDSKGDSGDDGQWSPCSDADPCPDSQFCFNGLCALGCTNNGDCADDQYCDTDSMLCQNQEVPTCDSADDCLGDQICVNDYCTTPPTDTSCDYTNVVEDGCASDAVCFPDADSESGACYTMPACAEDGSCPTGTTGAVCNDDYLPAKDKICLLGACESVSDCPSDWNCVRLMENAVLGSCGDGGFGSPCAGPEDCISGTCTPLPGLTGGICF